MLPSWLPPGTRRVGVDTMCFIYRFEANATFLDATEALFDAIERGDVDAVCSVLVLTELLPLPLRAGREDLARSYRQIVTRFPNLTLLPVDEAIAMEAATLRATHQVRSPDALHLATAIAARADAFVTADARLASGSAVPVVLLPQSS